MQDNPSKIEALEAEVEALKGQLKAVTKANDLWPFVHAAVVDYASDLEECLSQFVDLIGLDPDLRNFDEWAETMAWADMLLNPPPDEV
jgi:hypothetical protein